MITLSSCASSAWPMRPSSIGMERSFLNPKARHKNAIAAGASA